MIVRLALLIKKKLDTRIRKHILIIKKKIDSSSIILPPYQSQLQFQME